MKNLAAPRPLEPHQSSLAAGHVAFRKRVEAQAARLPERLFGIKKNSFKIRLSNRFIALLLRKGLSLASSAKEIQAALERFLSAPLSRFLSCGQLTFGDVLVIRTNEKNNEIEIDCVSKRYKRPES